MNSLTLAIRSIFILLIVKYTSAKIVLRENSKYDRLAEIYSSVSLNCYLTDKYGFVLSWRKIQGVRIENLNQVLSFNNLFLLL